MNSPEITRFDQLNLPERLMKGIQTLPFDTLTPIQAQALPAALKGHDIAGQAQTGTGKTLAFLIPILAKLADFEPKARRPGALVLSPTRELADQVLKDALAISNAGDYRCSVVFGGVGYGPQKEALEGGLHLLVATPGRLLDLEQSRDLSLSELQAVCIDEADRMFDMGFIKDVRKILRRCPPRGKRQTFLFTATLPLEVTELGYEHMEEPVEVRIDLKVTTPEKAEQLLYHLDRREKMGLLLGLLQREDWTQLLIFVNTRYGAEDVCRRLQGNGFKAGLLSGDVDQSKRLRLMEEFKKKELPILVATDVASRGLHIEGISHVVNYDVPQDPEDYVHRVGRTARAGRKGKVFTLACDRYVERLPAIEEYLGFKIPVAWMEEGDLAPDRSGPPKRRARAPAFRGKPHRGGPRRPQKGRSSRR